MRGANSNDGRGEGAVLFLICKSPHSVPQAPVRVRESLSLGRAPDNDLPTGDSRTSKHHAQIERTGGAYYLIDLGSTNGTWLNGKLIPSSEPQRLENGDTIAGGAFEASVLLRDEEWRPSDEELAAERENAEEGFATQLGTFEDLCASLSDLQIEIVKAVTGVDEPLQATEDYAGAYLEDPLGIIWRQDRFVRDMPEFRGRTDISTDAAFLDALADAIVLNGRTERLHFPEPPRIHDISKKTYAELKNVAFIVHGDLFPSHLFSLDDPATFNYRELLVSHKYKTDLEELLCQSKAVGVRRYDEIVGGRATEAAVDVFDAYLRLFSPLQERDIYPGQVMTLGFFSREGGSCRHRSAALQLMLQEAGIRSRYVRGLLMGSGQHAWVEVDSASTDTRAQANYTLVFDPNFTVFGRKSPPKQIQHASQGPALAFGIVDGQKRGLSEPTALGYVMPIEVFNTIWRPVERRVPSPAGPSGDTVVC